MAGAETKAIDGKGSKVVKRVGIFGPSECGKTTLAIQLSREFFRKDGMKSLVLDPYKDNWGEHAMVISDSDQFWAAVEASTHCVVIIDEATFTIDRNRDLTKFFTSIRHNFHKLIVCGHAGSNLLPIMRQQLETLCLFFTDEDSAKVWAKVTGRKELLEAINLQQFEFLFYRRFQPVKKVKLVAP